MSYARQRPMADQTAPPSENFAGCEPTRRPMVAEAMDDLQEQVGRLQAALENLTKRLMPVCRIEPSKPEQGGNLVPGTAHPCELAGAIKDASARLSILSGDVNALVNRLEV